jgi:hypothetical protein
MRKPSRLAVAIAATAAIAAAATGGTASWATAGTMAAHGNAAASSHAAAFAGGSKVGLTSKNKAPASEGAPVPIAHAVVPAAAAAHAKPKPAAKPKPKPKPVAKPKPKPSGPTKPYQIYDSVVPTAIPGGKNVATYSNGPYQASWAAVAGRGDVLWIDVNGSNPGANALDCEPGDATPAGAAAWVQAKLAKDPNSKPIVYTMKSWWPAVIANINALPGWMHSHVKYWVADPTGYDHILPGADATQWYWGQSYDITTANPGFWK